MKTTEEKETERLVYDTIVMSVGHPFAKKDYLSYRNKLIHRLKRDNQRADGLEERRDKLSKYGFQDLGHYQGTTVVLETIIDELDEIFGLPRQEELDYIDKEYLANDK